MNDKLLTDKERNELLNKADYDTKEYFFTLSEREKDSYLICGLPRKQYDEMILHHTVKMHIATKEIKRSKEFKQFTKEYFKAKKAIKNEHT